MFQKILTFTLPKNTKQINYILPIIPENKAYILIWKMKQIF